MVTPSTSTDRDDVPSETTQSTTGTVSEPGREQLDGNDFDSDAEREAYEHDYVSQAREHAIEAGATGLRR